MNLDSNKWRRMTNVPFMTYAFLIIQLVVFVLMELVGMKFGIYGGSENGGILLLFGAMTPSAIIENHQFWRFITPIFVHIGLTHIALNSLTLYFAGRILEPIIGHIRFFAVYVLSGILGNLLSFAFSHPNSISAGASTSLFGMFAAFIILGRIYPYHPMIRRMSQNMTLLIVLNLVMNIFDSGVDMFGHLGGAIGGILVMMVIGTPKKQRGLEQEINKHKRILSGIIFLFIIGFCLAYGFMFG